MLFNSNCVNLNNIISYVRIFYMFFFISSVILTLFKMIRFSYIFLQWMFKIITWNIKVIKTILIYNCIIEVIKVLTVINSSATSIKTQIAILIRTAMRKFLHFLRTISNLFNIKISLFPYVIIPRFHMITKQWVNNNLIICWGQNI